MSQCRTVYVEITPSAGRRVKRCSAEGRSGGRPCDGHAKQLAYLQSKPKLWAAYLRLVAQQEAKEAAQTEGRSAYGVRRPA